MCLKGYVGIKGCGADVPQSGQYINQLPGISLQSMQQVADSEQVTYVSVYNDVQDRAWRRLEADVRNKLRARYSLKTGKDLIFIQVKAEGEAETASPDYKGLVVSSGTCSDGANPFFAFYVNTVFVHLAAARESLDVHIINRYGETLDVITATNLTEGVNAVHVSKRYTEEMLFIGVDATDMQTVETVVEPDAHERYHYWMQPFCDEAIVHGAIAMKTAPALLATTSSTHGISGVITPVCDYSAIICSNKDLFLNAWMNLLGAELMTERIYSPRVNKLTTVDATDATALRDLYTAQYENALNEVVAGIRISEDDGCVECKQAIERMEVLP